ncbi:MAG: DNA/RNA non-specific endonuclease [Bacteroidota bacterium]
MIRNIFLSSLFLLFFLPLQAQTLDLQISRFEQDLQALKEQQNQLKDTLESLKLKRIQKDLRLLGLPALKQGEELIAHSAMMLVYDEQHEQAKWVAHVIVPEVKEGNVSRTNDFRVDPLIKTGTAVEQDYFLTHVGKDGQVSYEGFGYDRGHLAPSADFRWSQKALSESYFYSNMSPQVGELNRELWAELEGILRGYLYRFPASQLYVVSGPVLHDSLPKIERSINGVSIPEQYFKVVLDVDHQRAIGFVMPNKKNTGSIETYARSIDEVEALTGLDFFPALQDQLEVALESQQQVEAWLPPTEQQGVQPLHGERLPKHHFNTVTAKGIAEFTPNKKVNICGTVVSTKLTSKGHIFLNLDKEFPNQIFTAAIWADNRINFSYDPHIELKDKCICVEGQVRMSKGTPTMELKGEKSVKMWQAYK